MRKLILCAVLATSAGMVGCEKEETPPVNTGTTTGTNASGGTSSTPAVNTTGTADAMKQSASDATTEAQKAAAGTADAVKAGAADAQAAGSEKMAAVGTEAQKYFDEAMTYVKEKKWDLADGSIKKLEALKPNLSPEWQTKVDQLRKTFTAAKSGLGDMKVPGL